MDDSLTGRPHTTDSEPVGFTAAVPDDWHAPDPHNVQEALDDRAAAARVLKYFQCIFLETFDALVTSDGATILVTLTNAVSGDLTMVFSDGLSTFSTSSGNTIALTAGTDTVPKFNYVYVLQSTKALATSTSGFPAAAHIEVGVFHVKSAGKVQTNGATINQNVNDHVEDDTGQGHLTHIAQRIRRGGAIWISGTEGVATQDGNDLWVSIAAGLVSQMHEHAFDALDSDTGNGSDEIDVVNDPDAPFVAINSLNDITKHSDGSTIGNNKHVKYTLWAVANKTGTVSPMMLNLPSGEYNTQSGAEIDVDGKANFTIPIEFRLQSTTGFLVAAFVCKHTATAMLIESTQDLRGNTPFNVSGSGTGGGDVTAAAAITDNAIVRGDGGAKGVQDSGVLIDDSDNVTGATSITTDLLDVDNIRTDGNTISSTDTNGDVIVAPDGTGEGVFGNEGDTILGGSTTVYDLRPDTTLKMNLGTVTKQFNDLFAGGDIVLSGLPGADPTNAGQLWNDGGTLKVSAG